MDDAVQITSEQTPFEHAAGLPEIGARLDRLASSKTVWTIILLLSFGGFFDAYTLYAGGTIAPGLYKSHILAATTQGFFSLKGYAGFTSATFVGLLLASSCCGMLADKLGRRAIFTTGLVWFGVSGLIEAFQTTSMGVIFWRFMLAIGTGIEVITIDSYLSELVPKGSRGKAFAINNAIHSTGQPIAALAAFSLVPYTILGMDGWRWVVVLGSVAALVVWPLRMMIPESPRWLAAHGKLAEADKVVANIEARVERERGEPLPPPEPVVHRPPHKVGRYSQIFGPQYLSRTIMLSLFHIFQALGLFGFINWMPTFLVHQGISITKSIGYTFAMAIVVPLGPLVCAVFADKIERKWQMVGASLTIATAFLVFAVSRSPFVIIPMGALELLSAAILSYSFHAYQSELFPTRIRTQAIGFVYSWSRVSATLSAFLTAWVLRAYGVPAVFMIFTGSMVMVALCVGVLGPMTSNRSLETLSP
jgi:putative MFS transporter